MSTAERLAELLRPFYLLLMAAGYAWFFACMLPSMLLAFLLGRYGAIVLFPEHVLEGRWRGRPGYRRFFRFYGWRWTLAALAWDAVALGICVFLGGLSGWWVYLTPRGRTVGGGLAAMACLTGHLFPKRTKTIKEAKTIKEE